MWRYVVIGGPGLFFILMLSKRDPDFLLRIYKSWQLAFFLIKKTIRVTFFRLNWWKFVFSCNWHCCSCNMWSTLVQRKSGCSECGTFQREAIGEAEESMSSFFLVGNLAPRMTVIACFIVVSHNLAKYICQIYIFYPVSQKYLADLCSCIHYILVSDL